MSAPRARGGEPSVYARLAQQSDLQFRTLTPPRGTRLAGWLLWVAIGAATVAAALRVPGW